MSDAPDNLDLALASARGFLRGAEFALENGDWQLAGHAVESALSHLEWAAEVIKTRRRKSAKA